MKLFESRKEKFFKTVLLLFPLFLLLCIGLIFFIAIGRTSDATIQKEPNGSNLLPSISVIPLTGTNSERRKTSS